MPERQVDCVVTKVEIEEGEIVDDIDNHITRCIGPSTERTRGASSTNELVVPAKRPRSPPAGQEALSSAGTGLKLPEWTCLPLMEPAMALKKTSSSSQEKPGDQLLVEVITAGKTRDGTAHGASRQAQHREIKRYRQCDFDPDPSPSVPTTLSGHNQVEADHLYKRALERCDSLEKLNTALRKHGVGHKHEVVNMYRKLESVAKEKEALATKVANQRAELRAQANLLATKKTELVNGKKSLDDYKTQYDKSNHRGSDRTSLADPDLSYSLVSVELEAMKAKEKWWVAEQHLLEARLKLADNMRAARANEVMAKEKARQTERSSLQCRIRLLELQANHKHQG